MVNAKKAIMFTAVTLVALVVLVSARNMMAGGIPDVSATGNVVKTVSDASEDYQDALLKMVNYEYVLEPETLTAGVPVRMEVDLSTVYGCMRDVRIPAFGVSQYVKEGDNVIEFTPDKSGSFNVVCSMNMGRGKFNVAEESGAVADYIEPAPVAAAGGSCGAGGGSCGCGGA